MRCRICAGENTEKFLSLGMQPHCNNFLKKEQLSQEKLYPLDVFYCHDCSLVQIEYTVGKEVMFSEYPYVSGTTRTLPEHFRKSAEKIVRRFRLTGNDLVVDIGSNDGTWLKCYRPFGIRTLGVEPAGNIARIALDNGVETVNDFFNNDVAEKILEQKGPASVVTAAGVFFHLEQLHSVVEGISRLLKDDGVLVIQAIYLSEMLDKTSFDNIYHEHLCYYTLKPLQALFAMYEMEIFDAGVIDIHGGSLELYVAKKGAYPVNASVGALEQKERDKALDDIRTYRAFAERVRRIRQQLPEILEDVRSRGKTVYAYGAPAKGTTLLNYCGIGTDLVDCAVEKNPMKCGLYIPGVHIPIISEDSADRPDYYLILPWNFLDEFLVKEKAFLDKGGGFIVPVPQPRIIAAQPALSQRETNEQ